MSTTTTKAAPKTTSKATTDAPKKPALPESVLKAISKHVTGNKNGTHVKPVGLTRESAGRYVFIPEGSKDTYRINQGEGGWALLDPKGKQIGESFNTRLAAFYYLKESVLSK